MFILYHDYLLSKIPVDVNVNNQPKLTKTNFTLENNRAHGLLLETSNICIKELVFNRISRPSILFEPSFYWYSINNNEGIAQQEGIERIKPDPTELVSIVRNNIINIFRLKF